MNFLFAAIAIAAVFVRPMERVRSYDPMNAVSTYDCYACGLLYETPLAVDYKVRPYRLVSGVTQLPEISRDGKTYEFKILKKGITPENVIRSIDRIRDPKNVSPNAWLLKDVESVEKTSDDSFVIRLKRRSHYFPWILALPQMGIVLDDGSGTGPFELRFWRKNHEMRFVRRNIDQLGADSCRVDEVRYLVVDDPMTQWLMFLKGELNFIEDLSRDNLDAILSEDSLLDNAQAVSFKGDILQFDFIGFNMEDKVLGNNLALRRALNASFNFPEWKRFLNSLAEHATTPVPHGISGRIEDDFEYAYNIEKAKRLMVEAGYPDGVDSKTGRRLELTLTMGKASQQSREMGELIASFFEKIGVKLNLDFMTWDAFLTAVNEGRVQMFSLAWVGDYPDAQNFLQLFYSKHRRPGPNRFAYCNQEYDEIYEKALEAESEIERLECWRQCQEIIRSDLPLIMLDYKKSFVVAKKSLKGYCSGDFQFGRENLFRIEKQK
jgi:ABC-type transport system substrate-binding protein